MSNHVFVCSRALALSIVLAKALLRALIITIQPDMILRREFSMELFIQIENIAWHENI